MAIDWTKSMRQTYEFYVVNPLTWLDAERLDNVTGASVSRDITTDTVVSGSIIYIGELEEKYVRMYLVAEQDDEREKIPLATILCQTPQTTYNGKYLSTTISGYSPLIELDGEMPPIGYTVPRNWPKWYYKNPPAGFQNLMVTNLATVIPQLTETYCRAPVNDLYLETDSDGFNISLDVLYEDYIPGQEDTWKSVILYLLKLIGQQFTVDAMGHVGFMQMPKLNTLRPVWTYDDGNSSILSADISYDRDLYNVPNVVEIVFTTTTGKVVTVTAENDDESSPISIPNRGRRLVYREINPRALGVVQNNEHDIYTMVEDYAADVLESKSTLTYQVSYQHGYCPVYVGDCVLINHSDAGINNERAYVVSQHIECNTGCQVSEVAYFTKTLWKKI